LATLSHAFMNASIPECSICRSTFNGAPTPVEPGTVEIRSTVSMTVEVSEK